MDIKDIWCILKKSRVYIWRCLKIFGENKKYFEIFGEKPESC